MSALHDNRPEPPEKHSRRAADHAGGSGSETQQTAAGVDALTAELGETRRKYQALIDTARDFIWELDTLGRYTFCSPQMEKLWGIKPDEMIGKTPFDMVPAEHKGTAAESFADLVKSPRAFGLETVACDAQGRRIHLEIDGVPFFDGRGRLLGFRGITRDVTERRRAEEELREKEERFRLVFQNSAFAMTVSNARGSLLQCNPAFVELVGFSEAELKTLAAERYNHQEDSLREAPLINELLDGKRTHYNIEKRFIHKDGRIVWANQAGTLVRDSAGRPHLRICMIEDITERKQTEERLRLSETRYRQLFDSMGEGFLLVEPVFDETAAPVGYVFLDANAALAKLTRLKPEEIIGKDVREVLPDIEPHWVRAFGRVARTGNPEHLEEFSKDLNGWFDAYVFCPEPGKAAVIYSNTTERKLAEAERERLLRAVQEERDRLSALISSITDEVWFADTGGNFTIANPRALRGFALASIDGVEVEELAKKLDVYRPDGSVRPLEEAPPLRALNGEVVTGQEEIIRTPGTGELRYRQVSASPVRDAEGRILGSVSVARDITDRKRAEAEIHDREIRLRMALEAAGMVTWEWDIPSRSIRYSENIAAMVRGAAVEPYCSLDEMMLRVDAGDRERLAQALQQCADQGAPFECEYRLLMLDGAWRWILGKGGRVIVQAGRPVRVLGVSMDVTGRKLAEEAQLESENRLSAIIATLPVGVAVLDAAGRVLLGNEAMERIWGGATARPAFPSSIADTVRYQGWWAATGVALGAEDWASSRALIRGETSIGEIIDIQRFDGTPGTILNNATPLRDASGNVNGAVVAVMDVTELRQVQKALKEADRRKDEFVAMLAHELRNPLAAISSAIELFKLRGPGDPMLVRAGEAAARQTAHMARLLDDLLDVARVTQGRVTLNRQEVSLASILEAAIEAGNPFMNARHHRLFVSHPREPMYVYGDHVRLAQAVGNLLHNSAKFSAAGSEIYLVVEREEDQAVILVRDNGKGIEPELLPHVFELFVQASRSSDRAEGGLGIGLTLVRSIVELHGGLVEGRSEGAGRGSEFRIRLPLLAVAREQPAEAGFGKQPETRRLRILVVDDNVDSAELLSFLLQIDGHEVLVAHSGAAAVALGLERRPDVAVIDVGMPGMDGYEVARRLRGSAASAKTTLVALTGYGQQEDFQKSREAGFDHHLVKPVDPAILRCVLSSVRTEP